jgi:hypothetical protein
MDTTHNTDTDTNTTCEHPAQFKDANGNNCNRCQAADENEAKATRSPRVPNGQSAPNR